MYTQRSFNMYMSGRETAYQMATLKCLSSRNKDDTTESVEGERFSVFKNGSLQINQAGKEDSGEYVCFATNSEGKSAITALLDVKGISAP